MAGFSIKSPLSENTLKRLRLRAQKNAPKRGLGAHLRQKAGQSLVFREFRDYQLGDDIRLVDWAASRRVGRPNDRVVRRFEAEEQATLMILLDLRPAMFLPELSPKAVYAFWLAQALANVAEHCGDRLVIAPIFGGSTSVAPLIVSGRGAAVKAQKYVNELWQSRSNDFAALGETPQLSLRSVAAHLKPTSMVVVVSDFLFEDDQEKFTRFIHKARKNWRSVHLLPMNSIDAELAEVGASRKAKIQDIEGCFFQDDLYEFDSDFVKETKKKVDAFLSHRKRNWSGSGVVWHNPRSLKPVLSGQEFEDAFVNDMQHCSLLHWVSARGAL
ncbi:hypothetical protein TL5118_04170 [Thalassovita autumnalis]|uniref:DUF58 domain-containing protein n=1 Tax=Thalassovita autumnalis TaxID=2072972 RepID=A0A0P1FTN0_9RHOB|nr:DUF58 domain-containing protein [Thalassovita autumnalis]CUH70195.1 hypothetical protein TL5118_04170 [Thalassovita autumnalis]CUH71875.1 hypothetical protein TL5120_01667 [Thalassovita autumnalis]